MYLICRSGISIAAEVRKLRSFQQENDIILEYTLTAEGSERYDSIRFEISTDGGRSWKTPKGIYGDVGERVYVGPGKRITWSVLEEFPKGLEQKVAFRVEAAGEERRKVKRPKEWTDPMTGMEFAWVPAGCFQMGSPDSEPGRYSDENPVHEVCVDGFWMSKYEVTNAQYRSYKSSLDSKSYKGKNLNGKSQPAVNVSWDDAKAFSKWMTRKHSSRYEFRLPTETEWEYAGRAGTTTSRSWGDNPDDACRYANVHDLTSKRVNKFDWTHHNCDDGYAVTSPVGSFTPNRFGLYDMLGNVWEWCEDIYSKEAYSKHQRNNPIYTAGGTLRVLRGGGWSFLPRNVRSAFRFGNEPGDRYGFIGFRLVRTE